MPTRLDRLRETMKDENLEAVALVPGSALRYFAGTDLPFMERPSVLFVAADGSDVAIIPSLESEGWEAAALPARTVYWRDETGFEAAFAEAAARFGGGRIGVEGLRMRVIELFAIQKAFASSSVVDAQAMLSGLRMRKDADEIASLRRAISGAEAALGRAVARVRAGMTETEIAAILAAEIAAMPGLALPGAPLVLAGSNAARPHGHARPDYRVKRGDALLIDFGVTSDGYWSDITRTFFIEHASDEHRAFYDVVLRANAVGREAARAGTTAHAIDDAVQRHLEASAYAPFIVHKTGHGLGLDVHEAPQIMRGNLIPIEAGMVFTVEPGLYRPGELGVRIEDDVLVTEAGCESLSAFPRELTVIG